MISEKFGLVELQRYVDEVGLKRGDVRTIKGILAVVNIPNMVVEEISEVVGNCQSLVAASEENIAGVKVSDQTDAQLLVEEMVRLAVARKARKNANNVAVNGEKVTITRQTAEVRRLTKLLNKFA